MYSGYAQRALYLLQNEPMLFDSAVEESLQNLADARDEQGANDPSDAAGESEMVVLRKRMDEVRESERRRTVMELLYLKVCARFVKLQVPLVKPMPASGGVVQLGSANLKVLTDELYSKDALALVREHLMQFAGPGDVTWTSPMGSWVMIPLLQAGQVYAISAMFGYYLRQMDARYQLEKLVGAASGDTSGSDEEDRTLKEYISTFGEAEMKRMTNIASVEGRLALEAQVAALFGDLRVLKEKFAAAIGPVFSEEEASERATKAIQNGEVEVLRLASSDLQRLVLESVAFGSLLSDAEKQVECWYDLTPSQTDAMRRIMGDDGPMRALGE